MARTNQSRRVDDQAQGRSPERQGGETDLTREIARTRDAARVYHAILEERSADLRERFERDMRSERLSYGPTRLLCTTFRPHFITVPMLEQVERAVGGIVRALHRLGRLGVERVEVQDAVGMTSAERELAALHPGYDDLSCLSRMDAFLGEQGLHVVEYNAECPTGVGYNERLFRVFDRFEPMRAFRSRQPCRVTDGVADVLDTLLQTWSAWGGRGRPRIAIVDWSDVVTRGEFEIFAEYFAAQGVETCIVDPRALEMARGRLVAEGRPVDLVYRRLLVSEFLARREECRVFEQAYRARAACFVNSLRTKLLHKKLALALLHDPRFQHLLTAEERALARAHVPWTAALRPGPVERDGGTHDLAEYVVAHQGELVLKPNDDYGGKGIVVGCETSPEAWRAAVADALERAPDAERRMVVQQRIPLFQESFPDLDGQERTYFVDLDPFFFRERMYGFLTRISTRSVSNVSSGGGQIPTYVLE